MAQKLSVTRNGTGEVTVGVDGTNVGENGIRLNIRLGTDGQVYVEAYHWHGHKVEFVSMETGNVIDYGSAPHPWLAVVDAGERER